MTPDPIASAVARGLVCLCRRAHRAGLSLEQLLLLAQMPAKQEDMRGSKGGTLSSNHHLTSIARAGLAHHDAANVWNRSPAGDAVFAPPRA